MSTETFKNVTSLEIDEVIRNGPREHEKVNEVCDKDF